MWVLALALALVEEPVNKTGSTFAERHGHERYANPDITEKYDGWEQVLKIMFTVGCTSKHSTDIVGEAKHVWKESDGDTDMDAYVDEMKKIQSRNADSMKQGCGSIPAQGLPKCRMNCQTSWGDQMVPRDACDSKCEQKYQQFEAECYNKVDSLQNVYNVELGKIDSYATCAELHCPDFPVTTNCTSDELDDLDDCKAEMVTDMQKNVTVVYCDSLFEWIYESEARDPATGDPIVFLDVGAPEPVSDVGAPEPVAGGRKPEEQAAEPDPDCDCADKPNCGCGGRKPQEVRKAFLAWMP